MSHKDYKFEEDPHTAAFACRHVIDGAPVLYVSHDPEGDWQFLCGEGSHLPADGVLIGIGHVVERDPSINELAKMCTGHHAERRNRASPWIVTDEHEAFITACILNPGWSVQLLPAGDTAAAPAFAYTVGLFHNYQHAELLVVGLRTELMHAMLNDIAERIKAGEAFAIGDRLADVIEGFEVTLREVREPASFKEHVGYARWFYKGKPFPLLQVVWPDKLGRFPNEPGTAAAFHKQQPLLA